MKLLLTVLFLSIIQPNLFSMVKHPDNNAKHFQVILDQTEVHLKKNSNNEYILNDRYIVSKSFLINNFDTTVSKIKDVKNIVLLNYIKIIGTNNLKPKRMITSIAID